MKVLFITHYDNPYGANNALLYLVKEIKKSKEHVPIVVIPSEGEFTRILESEGIDYIVNSITQWQAPYKEPISFALKKRKRVKLFYKELEELESKLEKTGNLDIDLIHSNSSVIGTGAFLAKKLGCKHVWHIREFSFEHFNMHYFFNKKIVKEMYNNADALITISDALKENYRQKYPKANVVRIYDGIGDMDVLDKEELDDGITRFVYAGYLFPMKKQLSVIRACGELLKRGIKEFDMSFLGEGKPEYKKKLLREIKRLNLEDNVHLLGYVRNVGEYLKKSDVGIIASRYEGFGLVTVEYMKYGLPVIGYKEGGTSEIVVDGDTGILYESSEELVDAMQFMINNPMKAIQLGANGLIRSERFNAKDNAKAVVKIYSMIDSLNARTQGNTDM